MNDSGRIIVFQKKMTEKDYLELENRYHREEQETMEGKRDYYRDFEIISAVIILLEMLLEAGYEIKELIDDAKDIRLEIAGIIQDEEEAVAND